MLDDARRGGLPGLTAAAGCPEAHLMTQELLSALEPICQSDDFLKN